MMPAWINLLLMLLVIGMTVAILSTHRQWNLDWQGTASRLGLMRRRHQIDGEYRGRQLFVMIKPETGAFGSTHLDVHLNIPADWVFELRPVPPGRTERSAQYQVRLSGTSPTHLMEELLLDTVMRQHLITQAQVFHLLRLSDRRLEYIYQGIAPGKLETACDLMYAIADMLENHKGGNDDAI